MNGETGDQKEYPYIDRPMWIYTARNSDKNIGSHAALSESPAPRLHGCRHFTGYGDWQAWLGWGHNKCCSL